MVEIYVRTTCPYSHRAKELLDSKGVKYNEIVIEYGDEEGRRKMIARTGGPSTFPEVFVNDNLIGGYDDLQALEDCGELDAILAADNLGG